MRFLLSFAFLVSIFYAQAADNFLETCNKGTIDVRAAFSARLALPVADISNSLTKTYALCLEAALKLNTDILNDDAREKLRSALNCHLGQCVNSVYSGSILADVGVKLSGYIKLLKSKTSCTAISTFRRGSLNDVATSVEVRATLDSQKLRTGPLTGILNNILGLLADLKIISILDWLGRTLGLQKLINGLILTVSGLLYGVVGNIESLLLGISININVGAGSGTPREEIFTVYKCDLGTGVVQDFTSCNDINIAINQAVSIVVSLKGLCDSCLDNKLKVILSLNRYKDITDLCTLI